MMDMSATGVTADVTLPAAYTNLVVTEIAATPTIVWTDGAARSSAGITNVTLAGTNLQMTLASGRYHFQLSSGPAAALSFVEDNDLRVAYTGDFRALTGLSTANYSNGTVQSGTGSASFSCVSCTQLGWLSATGPARGIAAVSVDGLPPTLVDLYTSTQVFQKTVWASGPLVAGPHTVRITGAGKDPLSTSAVIEVDAIGLTGTAGAVPTVVDDTDPRFSYVGFAAYTGMYPSLYIGGDVHTSVRAAQATFSCASCTSIALVSPTSPARGIIQISIDGGPPTTVDLYTTTPFYERTVYVSPLLASGPHTMTIISAGKNPASASGTFEIDGVKLVGS